MLRSLFFVLAIFLVVQARNSVYAQTSEFSFIQKIQGLKQGQLPPNGFIQALERHDNPKAARNLCLRVGLQSGLCESNAKLSLGWVICMMSGLSKDECDQPKVASLGFGLCMAAGRDSTDCNYVQHSSSGFGLCMVAGRNFHECTGTSMPTLAFAYCMARGRDVSNCMDAGS